MTTTKTLQTPIGEAPTTNGPSIAGGLKNRSSASLAEKSADLSSKSIHSAGNDLPSTQGRDVSPLGDDIALEKLSPLDPSSGLEDQATTPTGPEMTLWQEKMYLGALCLCLSVAGWNDGTIGALLPRIQDYYKARFGGFVSPFVATQFAPLRHWNFFFLTSLGVAAFNAANLVYVFRMKRQAYFIPETHPKGHKSVESKDKYKQILSKKSVNLVAFFLFFHVGTGATMGGWIFTYLIKERGAGPSAGYVRSGISGGVTLGRIILLPLNSLIGHKYVILLYCAISIGLVFVVWFVPNMIGDAVAASFVGLFLGPFYPIAMNVISGLLPSWLLPGSIGWIAAFGPAGAALFPFITGKTRSSSASDPIPTVEPVQFQARFSQSTEFT
ncbi:hypothetical protein FRC05_000274 [Tulasnella sp. 425]|nr:hypothetical protein FRC05_000274 [Tulasnella sp. 425]